MESLPNTDPFWLDVDIKQYKYSGESPLKKFGFKKGFFYLFLGALAIFFAYRMIRPMNIFVVSEEFERPMPVTVAPSGLDSLKATECGGCHSEIFKEWSESMHAMAWTDPYYQVDFVFDGSQQICFNCHIPLQNQQENLVLGFRDREKFKPILAPNPDFDRELQKEGVTCAVCHVREGFIIGPYGDTDAPHPTRREPGMTDGIGTCKKCHVVSGKRWDTFYRIPPCGTVAEIREGDTERIDCTACHMPAVVRPVSDGGSPRPGRMHRWKGGHHPETVRRALRVELEVEEEKSSNKKRARITLANIGADHYLPTGTPDRHLTVEFRLKDDKGKVLKEKRHILKRTILWRPFIIDLWDTRLAKGQSRTYFFDFRTDSDPTPAELEVIIRYHLLEEARRKRIGYQNEEPISYVLYHYNFPL